MDRLYPIAVTTPAHTAIATPLSTPWPIGDYEDLLYVDIIIPDGHGGTTGIKILWSGTQVIPYDNTAFLVGNDEKIHVEADTYITQNALTIVTYNTDVWPHTHWLRAMILDPYKTKQPVIGANGMALLGIIPDIPIDPLGPDFLIPTPPPDSSGGETTGHVQPGKNVPPTRHTPKHGHPTRKFVSSER